MKQRDFYKFDLASIESFDDKYLDDDDDEYIRELARCHSENIMKDRSSESIRF